MKTKLLLLVALFFVLTSFKSETLSKTVLKKNQYAQHIKSIFALVDYYDIGGFTAGGNYYEAFGGGGADGGNVSYVVPTDSGGNPIGAAITPTAGTYVGHTIDSLSFVDSVTLTFSGDCWY